MFNKKPAKSAEQVTEDIRKFCEELKKRDAMVPKPFRVVKDPILLERKQFHWWSWYPKEVRDQIHLETAYLLVLLFVVLFLIWATWRISKEEWVCWLLAPTPIEQRLACFQKYSFAFLGGILGGIAFCMKWLYHSAAKGAWHEDRKWWRILTPFLSGIFALALFLLIGPKTGTQNAFLGFGFLIGFFSDRAVGKLGEIADTILGRSKEGGTTPSPPAGPESPAGVASSSLGTSSGSDKP